MKAHQILLGKDQSIETELMFCLIKLLSQNGKVNHFKTDQGLVEMGGFEITRQTKTGKSTKIVTNYFDFSEMRGSTGRARMNAAKRAFNSLMLAGLRGKNNIEFTCNNVNSRNRETSILILVTLKRQKSLVVEDPTQPNKTLE